jgi:L-asparaginase
MIRRSLFAVVATALLSLSAIAAESKPKVTILTTGGTIAGQSDARSAIGYNASKLGAQQLIAAVPGIDALAQLSSEAISQVGSQNMTEAIWFTLARRIGELFARGEADAVVITHGTDTMEETAFFLDLVLPPGKAVVLVGAMRPSTALGADGPANLYHAVEVAASASARQRGVLVVLNGTIHAARAVQKMQTSALETFHSPIFGPLGYVDAASVRFTGAATAAAGNTITLPSQPLPRVEIVYAHAQMDGASIDDAIKRGARGIVVAGVGSGNAADPAMDAMIRAVKAGLVVVRASRVGQGFVDRNVEVDDDKLGFVAALDLSPQKARILTQLLIANRITDPLAVQKAFER